jgi:hypothetical protein
VVEGAGSGRGDVVRDARESEEVDVLLRTLAGKGLRPKEIAARLAGRTGLARREIYARAVDVCNALDESAPCAEADGAVEP